jgi:hypothetical protein
MAGGESRMAGGEPRMTGDCCRPEGSIHRCVRTHSHLYSYIYGLVALLDNIQSSFSSITISTGGVKIKTLLFPGRPMFPCTRAADCKVNKNTNTISAFQEPCLCASSAPLRR